MKCGVIDIGSNSVRLMLWSDGKTLYKRLNVTRLGEGVQNTGTLQPAAMERSAAAVQAFVEQAKADGATEIFAFATAAVRSAKNGAEFVDSVFKRVGIRIDVVSGETEGKIGLDGALGEGDGGIVDIGGASSEITIRRGGKIDYSYSLNLGAVRLNDLCGRDRAALEREIEGRISAYGTVPNDLPLSGIGGTATSIAAIALGLTTYDGRKVQDYRLTLSSLKTIVADLFSRSPEEIAATTCLPLKRAEIIAGGALLLEKIMEYVGIDSLRTSEKDNLEGYLIRKGIK